MQKLTIFSIFVSAILLVLVAELLSNDYFNSKNVPENMGASLFTDTNIDSIEDVKDSVEGIVRDSLDTDNDSPNVNPLSGKSHLTTAFLKQVGFIDPSIDTAQYNGKFFDFINLADVGITDVIKGKINEKDELIAIYFEIRSENISTAKEVYTLTKEKAKGDINVSVNETNSYGDNSFYINHLSKKDQVYLVVRIRNYVYGFNYTENDHKKFENLIKVL